MTLCRNAGRCFGTRTQTTLAERSSKSGTSQSPGRCVPNVRGSSKPRLKALQPLLSLLKMHDNPLSTTPAGEVAVHREKSVDLTCDDLERFRAVRRKKLQLHRVQFDRPCRNAYG